MPNSSLWFRAALALVLLSSACGLAHGSQSLLVATADETRPAASSPAEFLRQLHALCGKAFAGRVVADTPASTDNPFAGKKLIMHVRECAAGETRVPFHVGDDHSRTWVFTADTGTGQLRLKHDHRHADGSADAMTWYGGDSRVGAVARTATGWRYEFPADAESQQLFRRLDRAVSVPNVWAVELDARRFVYELARPNRLFRVEFDLTRPQALPPAPWGAPAGK